LIKKALEIEHHTLLYKYVSKFFRFYKYLGIYSQDAVVTTETASYEGWNFNSGNYLFTTDTK